MNLQPQYPDLIWYKTIMIKV